MAASIGTGAGGTNHLVSLNPGNPLAVTGVQGTFGGAAITGLAPVNGNLFASSRTAVFPVNLGNTNNIANSTTPVLNGPISGLGQNVAGQIFVQTNNAGATSELYWINPVQTPADNKTGTDAIDFGPLPATAIVNNTVQLAGQVGANPGSMAFDPTLNGGTLFSFDLATHQLYTVSQTNRTRALTIFQIYISSSDSTGRIFTSNSNVPTSEGGTNGNMTPYGGPSAALMSPTRNRRTRLSTSLLRPSVAMISSAPAASMSPPTSPTTSTSPSPPAPSPRH